MAKLDKTRPARENKETELPESPGKKGEQESGYQGMGIALGMCFGTALGSSFGLMLGNLALGISLGLCFGMMIGAVIDAARSKKK